MQIIIHVSISLTAISVKFGSLQAFLLVRTLFFAKITWKNFDLLNIATEVAWG